VRVNAVAPGLVDPPPGWSEERIERFRRRIPQGRLPSTEDVVATVLSLIENDAVTGQVLVVDGGQTLSF
jgi:NAD(P)-dependent dehydrogenase (short-subunit alcohol dehydrogenase family)